MRCAAATLDPGFRDGAATRLLGTLYVIAPGALARARRLRAGHRAARGARAASIRRSSRTSCASPRPTSRSAIRIRRACPCASASRTAARCAATTSSCSTSWWRRPVRRTATSRAERLTRGRVRERVRPLAREDPERGGQRREVRDHREHERERGERAELAQRRQIRQREGEEAARVDQRREQDRAPRDRERVAQRAWTDPLRRPSWKW